MDFNFKQFIRPKRNPVTFSLTEDMYAEVKTLAEKNEVTISTTIEGLVNMALSKLKE